MVCSREERGFELEAEVGGFLLVEDREVDSMSTKWKVGVREMSRPYITFAYQRTASLTPMHFLHLVLLGVAALV